MDLTDRNNEKFHKLTTVLGTTSIIYFYYNKTTKDFRFSGMTQAGCYPGESVEKYVIDNLKDELREHAEAKIKARGGLTAEQRAEKEPFKDDGEGVRRFYGNRSVD